MARSNIPMVINLRQNKNDVSTAYGKYFAEVDAKEPLNLKGLANHMMEHGKISSEEMCNLVLGEMVKCMVHLLHEGMPIKLDGFGTFSPSVDGQGNGKVNLADAVAGGADAMINGIRINFTPENTKGEELTSRALKKECTFEWGYLVESEVRMINGKQRRFQKKTPLSYVLAPQADDNGGGTETPSSGGSSQNGGSQTQTVMAPEITGTTPFTETTSVSIQAEQGVEIRYTTDGSTPTAESTLYSEPFTLSDSATVKAIAIMGGVSSQVSTKSFTKGSGGGSNGGGNDVN